MSQPGDRVCVVTLKSQSRLTDVRSTTAQRTPRTLPARWDESSRHELGTYYFPRGLINRGRQEQRMSVTDIRHNETVSDDVQRSAAEIKAALRDLPVADQEAVQDRLFQVAAQFQETGQVDPLIHFIQSLSMTARLHRNPAYRKSLAVADEAAGCPPADVIDVAAYMQQMRERRTK